MSLSGIVIINKEQGISSHTEMRRVQKLFGATKAGHAGTLDPLATGMLPIYFGEATKFIQYALDADKTYIATGYLGSKTDTADSTGTVIWQHPNPVQPLKEQLQTAISQLTGTITQIPSMYSALKHNGKPLYHYARKGQDIARLPRTVEIKSFELIEYNWPLFTVRVICSKGTYIRNLLEDLGDKLSLGAHLTRLFRESVLGFSSHHMQSYDNLQKMQFETLQRNILSIDYGLQHFDKVYLQNSEITALQQGKIVICNQNLEQDAIYRIYDFNEKYYGLCKIYLNKDILEIRAHRMLSPE